MAEMTGPLVSADWLGKQLHDDEIRIVDCRFYSTVPEQGRMEYLTNHIPGAVYLSLDDDLAAPEGPGRHPLPDPVGFASTLGAVGIGDRHTVIVYDQHDSGIAARLWWMMRSLGHQRTLVLDGGWTSWIAEPRSATSEVPGWETEELDLAAEWTGAIDRETIVASGDGLFLIDSRSAERHRGEVEPIDPVAGSIPGSFNIPYQGNTDELGRFLPPSDLQERFRAVVDTSGQVIVYCGSGVTACNNILAMELAGITEVILYPGSWSDWCTSG
jgi:thiosulfate/3-mercaptopyruvate sulfurtransferase